MFTTNKTVATSATPDAVKFIEAQEWEGQSLKTTQN